jgi:hypothetical protein
MKAIRSCPVSAWAADVGARAPLRLSCAACGLGAGWRNRPARWIPAGSRAPAQPLLGIRRGLTLPSPIDTEGQEPKWPRERRELGQRPARTSVVAQTMIPRGLKRVNPRNGANGRSAAASAAVTATAIEGETDGSDRPGLMMNQPGAGRNRGGGGTEETDCDDATPPPRPPLRGAHRRKAGASSSPM